MKFLFVILPVIIITGVSAVVYFALSPDSLKGIMTKENLDKYIFIMPIVITGFVLLITAAALAPLFMGLVRNVQLRKRLELSGVRAKGLIMNVRDTGVTINNNPMVKLDIQIKPGFNTTIKKTVSRLDVPREGDEIEVLYDPANPVDAVAV